MVTSTGTTTCVGHRPVNSSTSPVINPTSTGSIISASEIDSLRNAIKIEIDRWAQHAAYVNVRSNPYYTTLQTSIVSSSIADELPSVNADDDAMVRVGGAGYPGSATIPNSSPYPAGATVAVGPDVSPPLPDNSFFEGTFVTAANYQTLLNSYNTLRADCICNSDCSCNAVCACHGDCGCNYSDERLKKEIVYC